jgi:uncharacterized protein YcbK (DUF882 family)
MGLVCGETDRHRSLKARLARAISAAIVVTLAAGLWAGFGSEAQSGGETRTISLYHIHTKESLTVSYMVNGRYVPSAMKKINRLMRDWRRNQAITMDPKTIDLIWELHADLGSKAPIHVVCGYRSAATNSFLKRNGRGVARKSQHILGKAIDIYFPDVSTLKMRNSALVRQVGGVGYYRRSAGPTGFLHVDSGRVRHWGPGISAREMAAIFRDYRKTVGARLNRKDTIMVADSSSNAPSQQKAKKPAVEVAYSEDEDEIAELSEKAAKTPVARPKLVEAAVAEAPRAEPIPKPRARPIEVLMMAAANMKIEPASAPPEQAIVKRASPVLDSIGAVEAPETMMELAGAQPVSNLAEKTGLAESLREGTEAGVPVIRAMTASAGGEDLFWWPQQMIFSAEKAVRRDGAPRPFAETVASLLPGSADAAEVEALPRLALAASLEAAEGKGDLLVVNRDGKENLPAALPAPPLRYRLGMLQGR